MRTRFERLVYSWRSLVQTAAAATIAYLFATEVVGHAAAVLRPDRRDHHPGVTVGQRRRRAVELALGVAVGIAVADGLVLLTGPGAGALALVVLLAMATALFLGSGQIFATQAAVSAVLIATLQPPGDGLSGARFVDALIGGGIALLVNSLLLPADPLQLVRRAAEPVLDELALTLERIAEAIESGDQEAAERALLRARDLDELEAHLLEAVAVSRETARFAPVRRRDRAACRLLRRGRRPDRPRDPQRPRARPRRRARRAAGGEPAAAGRAAIRDLAEAVSNLREALVDPRSGRRGARARAARRRAGDARAPGDRQPVRDRRRRPGPLDRRRPAARLGADLRGGRRASCARRPRRSRTATCRDLDAPPGGRRGRRTRSRRRSRSASTAIASSPPTAGSRPPSRARRSSRACGRACRPPRPGR